MANRGLHAEGPRPRLKVKQTDGVLLKATVIRCTMCDRFGVYPARYNGTSDGLIGRRLAREHTSKSGHPCVIKVTTEMAHRFDPIDPPSHDALGRAL